MKRVIAISLLLVSCNQFTSNPSKSESTFSLDNKKAIVYTTADSTELRLSATDTLQFSEQGQPVETQVCVFVDPGKKWGLNKRIST